MKKEREENRTFIPDIDGIRGTISIFPPETTIKSEKNT
jgi:hypothetical protein